METYSFDTMINRRGTNCSKWDAIPYELDCDDVIPMWVADMDFACPPAVMDSIQRRLSHPVFGYMQLPENYWSCIINWHKRVYGAAVEQSDIIPVASVLGGVAMAIQAFTKKGDAVLVPTPGYHAFYNSIVYNERRLVISPMIRSDDSYELDFVSLEQTIRAEEVKLILFCSPHNPTGRIWTTEELSFLLDICIRNHVLLISDEIHADMTLTNSFTTIFSSDKRAKDVAVALYSPTKTFNIAGLCTAYAVIKNQELRLAFNHALLASGLKVKNALGISALIGAYEDGFLWRCKLQTYLSENARFAVSFINKNIRLAHAYVPEATYFLWIDFSQTGLNSDQIIEKCVYEAHVAITRGTDFIAGGELFVRLNYACSHALLKEGLERLARVFN